MKKSELKTGQKLIIICEYLRINDPMEAEVLVNFDPTILLIIPKEAANYQWSSSCAPDELIRSQWLNKLNYSRYFQFQYGSSYMDYMDFEIIEYL